MNAPAEGSRRDAEIGDHEILTPLGVARLVGVNPKTVTVWAKSGALPSFRTQGGHRRFRRSDVERVFEVVADLAEP